MHSSGRHQHLEALLDELDELEQVLSRWQDGTPPSQADLRRARRDYQQWYQRALREIGPDKQDTFADMYEGGVVARLVDRLPRRGR